MMKTIAVPSATPTTTERLAFTVQLKRLVVDAPTKLPLHHSIYIKWQRGKLYHGKLTPVPCPPISHPRSHHRADGQQRSSAQVEVELPSSHQLQFEVNVHSKLLSSSSPISELSYDDRNNSSASRVGRGGRGAGRSGGGASASPMVSMEKKTLTLEMYYLRYEDHTRIELKTRTLIARVTIDLRDWLKDARVGQASTFLCPFDGMSLIDGEFVARPVKSSGGAGGGPSGGLSSLSERSSDCGDGDDTDGCGDGSPLAVEDIDFPFAPIGIAAAALAAADNNSNNGRQQQHHNAHHQHHIHSDNSTSGGDNTAILDAATLLEKIGGTRNTRAILESVMEDGLFRAVTIHNPLPTSAAAAGASSSMVVATVFDRLFSDRHGRLGASLHATRGDQSYDHRKPLEYVYDGSGASGGTGGNCGGVGGARSRAPSASPSGAAGSVITTRYAMGGSKSVSFRLRIARDKFVDAIEHTTVCYLRGDIVAHLSIHSPNAPIVGDGLRLECVIHITSHVHAGGSGSGNNDFNGGGGVAPVCTVAMYVHTAVASSKLKFMFGTKIAQHTDKISILLEQVVKQLTAASKGTGALRPLRGSIRFRASVNLGSSAASLDPNLWRRLGDENTLPHASLVLQTIKRLIPVASTQRSSLTSAHIVTLENTIGYHRHDVAIVIASMQLLMAMVKTSGGGATNVAVCSSTFYSTIRSVQGLHALGLLDFAEPVLRQIHVAAAAIQEQRLREVAGAAKNLWTSLKEHWGDASLVVHILERIHTTAVTGAAARARAEGGLSAMWLNNDPPIHEKVHHLAAVLSLHTQSLGICEAVCVLLESARDRLCEVPMDNAVLAAIRTAYRVHSPKLAERCPQLLRRVEDTAEGTMTAFQKTFGAVVSSAEEPIFECMVIVQAPTWRTGKAYVTSTELCLVDEVIPLTNIRRINLFRSLLRPAVRLFMIATVPDYDIVLFSRAGFLQALRDVGCGWMIHDNDEEDGGK